MIHWLRSLSAFGSGLVASALVFAADSWADSPAVRNVIALGATVAALGVIWTKIIRPAVEYSKLPSRMDRLEESHQQVRSEISTAVEQARMNGVALDEIRRAIELHMIPPDWS